MNPLNWNCRGLGTPDLDGTSSIGVIIRDCKGERIAALYKPLQSHYSVELMEVLAMEQDSSNSDSDDRCDGEGNYSAFMTIDHVASSDDLSVLVEELGDHSELESIGIIEESDDEEDEGTVGLQEAYNSLLEKTGEYVKVANTAIKKMKRADEDYRSLLVQHKEAKCQIEKLNGELSETYAKVRFLELEVVQANAKVERVSIKKLDDVNSSQKHFSDKSGLGYTGETSSAVKIAKKVKFVKVKEPVVAAPYPEKEENEKKKNVVEQRVMNEPRNHSLVKPEARRKSLPRSQRGPRTNHFFLSLWTSRAHQTKLSQTESIE
ncbi:hypothetical protein SO802_033304 [Lithocarpus litseifolius]|uniref:Uncharacterized protein n=1 Tax=Lithocarpus litseifolius TaxID=425828 RepID=A0AAW2BG48_9ROSI